MDQRPKGTGGFCLSLDFELMWGVRDRLTIAEYGANVLGERRVVPRLLEVFAAHDLACTWATVGLLFFDDRDAMMAAMPELRPDYKDARLSPYTPQALADVGASEREDPYHFGLSMIRAIAAAPRQEIGTHTFSHYYCLEPGQDVATFGADLAAAKRAAASLALELKSIVFPRNQFNASYLSACRDNGIIAYRGNERSPLYAAAPHSGEWLIKRAGRLGDAYVNLSGANGHTLAASGGMVDVPSSRFLRPFSKRLALGERARLARVVQSMRAAARAGRVFHLWFHPHNFGVDQDENFAMFENIAIEAARLDREYGWPSRTMSEFALEALAATGEA